MKIRLGERDFVSKAISKKYVMDVVNGLIGQDVKEDSEHYELLVSLWKRSEMYVAGAIYFVITTKPYSDAVAIRTVAREGKIIDWSIRGAISGRDGNKWSQLTSALRIIIRPQIRSFKERTEKCCEICNANDVALECSAQRCSRVTLL